MPTSTQTKRQIAGRNLATSLGDDCVIDLTNCEPHFVVGIRPSETEQHPSTLHGLGSHFLYGINSHEANNLFLKRLRQDKHITPLRRSEYKPGYFLYHFDYHEDSMRVKQVVDQIHKDYSNPKA